MIYERFTGKPHLAVVCLRSKIISLANKGNAIVRQVALHFCKKILQCTLHPTLDCTVKV